MKPRKTTNSRLYEKKTRTLQPYKARKQTKLNVENTNKIPVLGASSSDGAGWRDIIVRPPPPKENLPPYGSAKPITK